MEKYFKHFMIPFIILGVFAVITIGMRISSGTPFFGETEETTYTRTNQQSTLDERVFDYADVLTAAEEKNLTDLIEKSENSCGCDIILVTLDDSSIYSYNQLMNWADDFYDENKMGFDRAYGDGCVYVDNWATGDTWLSTCGDCEYAYSSSEIDYLIEDVCEDVNEDPYGAYCTYVNSVTNHMKRYKEGGVGEIPVIYIVLAALVVSVIYALIALAGNKGKRTTNATTYLDPRMGNALFSDHRDVFLTKHVTRHIISSGSGGGGGGGHHISSGGVSHGGGGGHH